MILKLPIPPKYQMIFLISLALLVVSVTASTTYFYLAKKSDPNRTAANPQTDELLAGQEKVNIQEIPLGDLKSINILLIGYGGYGHPGGHLADVVQILHLNFEKNLIALISIPRDLWIELPNQQGRKINATFTLKDDLDSELTANSDEYEIPDWLAQIEHKDSPGEPKMIKNIVSNITNLPIYYYIAVDFLGFKRAVGVELDGIEVNVGETLDDPWYPIQGQELATCGLTPEEVAEVTNQYSGYELEKQFPCRYEHLHFEKGLVQMEGGDALAYVRSRHGSAGGDFSRSRRQYEVLLAIKEKLFSLQSLDNIPDFYEQITEHIQTDINVEVIKYLAPVLKLSQNYRVININLSTDNVLTSGQSASGQFILYPKAGMNEWGEMKTFLQKEIN